jgi:hypothetical protein
MFAANIDRQLDDHNEPMEIDELEDDAGIGDDDLPDAKELRFALKAGIVFANAKEIRAVLKAYSVKEIVKIKIFRNETARIDVVAWVTVHEVYVLGYGRHLKIIGKEAMVVRNYCGTHRCERVWELMALTATFLTNYFMDEFRDNQKMDLHTFATKVTRKFNLTPNRWKLRRARKRDLIRIHGYEVEQFSLLRDYGNELMKSNLGSKSSLAQINPMWRE